MVPLSQVLLGAAHLLGSGVLLYPIMFHEKEFIAAVDTFGPTPDLYSWVLVLAGLRLALMGLFYLANQRQM